MGNCVSAGGKRDEHLILPINDSLSLTLNSDEVERNSNQFMPSLLIIRQSDRCTPRRAPRPALASSPTACG